MIKQTPFGKENVENRKELVVLVGPPAIGKSTYVDNNFPDSYIISRDDIVDEVAREYGFTYDDMFKDDPVVKKANSEVNQRLVKAFADASESNMDIVVDMTHMSSKARRSALERVKNKQDYFKRAIVFTMDESDMSMLLSRMAKRSDWIKSQGGSKTIGKHIIDRMISNYQEISIEEGFDLVEVVNTFK